MSLPRPPECVTGDQALARGVWAEAREAFEAVLRVGDVPEALEGLGKAAWWLDLADLVFDARERAYRLYQARGERAAAARIAVWLAGDYWAFRGEHAVANGWLQRARRLLEGQSHPTDEHIVVVSGALTFGMGDALTKDAATNKTLAPGGFALMPSGMNHFAYTTGQETTIVLYGQGPVEFKYVNPDDDPRKAKKGAM